MGNILIVGAGRLGKGFIGEVFDKANWKISFLDKDEKVIKNLNENGCYYVTVHREDRIEERTISGYKAYTYEDIEKMKEDIISADVIALVLYPEDFHYSIDKISDFLKYRIQKEPNKNLDILCLTNKNYLINGFNEQFINKLNNDIYIKWYNEHVSLRDTIVRRGTDADDNASIHVRTTAVLSLLIQEPLLVPLNDVEWLECCDKLELLKDLKVFTVNGPHVATAFAGYLKGYKTINETLADIDCLTLIENVHKEIYAGILKGYDISKEELDKLSVFPKAKGEMEDYIYRVAYDPIRKLSRNDRLTGIAMICIENGIEPDSISKSIANGFAYDYEGDPNAMQIQKTINKKGIEKAIVEYCGIESSSILHDKIKFYYNKITK